MLNSNQYRGLSEKACFRKNACDEAECAIEVISNLLLPMELSQRVEAFNLDGRYPNKSELLLLLIELGLDTAEAYKKGLDEGLEMGNLEGFEEGEAAGYESALEDEKLYEKAINEGYEKGRQEG